MNASRLILAILFYAVAFAAIFVGVHLAPSHGWPVNDSQLNGCALLIIGMVAKVAGHVALMGVASR